MGVLVRLALAALLLAGGCFAPDQRDGVVACATDRSCPPDFQCDERDNLCYRELPPPGQPDAREVADASVTDGPIEIVDAPPYDASSLPECGDGVDNDCDGRIDFGVDPGCSSSEDDDEHGTTECDDGLDNDEDGQTDFQIASPTCTAPKDDNCNSPFDDNEN
jgi:hypothetical protein